MFRGIKVALPPRSPCARSTLRCAHISSRASPHIGKQTTPKCLSPGPIPWPTSPVESSEKPPRAPVQTAPAQQGEVLARGFAEHRHPTTLPQWGGTVCAIWARQYFLFSIMESSKEEAGKGRSFEGEGKGGGRGLAALQVKVALLQREKNCFAWRGQEKVNQQACLCPRDAFSTTRKAELLWFLRI